MCLNRSSPMGAGGLCLDAKGLLDELSRLRYRRRARVGVYCWSVL